MKTEFFTVVLLQETFTGTNLINKFNIETIEFCILSKTGKVIYRSNDFQLISEFWEKFKNKIGYKFTLMLSENLDPNNKGTYLTRELLKNLEQKRAINKETYAKVKGQLSANFNSLREP